MDSGATSRLWGSEGYGARPPLGSSECDVGCSYSSPRSLESGGGFGLEDGASGVSPLTYDFREARGRIKHFVGPGSYVSWREQST